MKQVIERLNKIKDRLRKLFVADELEPSIARKKHIRLGVVVAIIFIAMICLVFIKGNTPNKATGSKAESHNSEIINKIDIENLAQGTSTEKYWTESAGKDVEEIKQKQFETAKEQGSLKEYVEKDKVSKEDLAETLKSMALELEDKYNKKLESELSKLKIETEKQAIQNSIEARPILKKSKLKKFGDYIPGNSYAKGKLILGVDAGVGIGAEANPRRAFLRITGEVVSAGNLRSDKLIGCTAQCSAVGNISSEKVYCQLVLMTCERKPGWSIEIPIKAEVASLGKVGIRGEVISREGDMVLRSFLSGIVGGFGTGIAQYSQPYMAVSNGLLMSGSEKAKDIGMRGFGSGVATSSDKLSDYFIKRAEQYQPVISINEGVDVEVLFQEGFNLTGDDNEK
jgi:conjugal transfer pilus assembly protein TraB